MQFDSPFPAPVAFVAVPFDPRGAVDLHAHLHPAEVAGLSANAVPKRRSEYVAGRQAARQALATLGQPPGPLMPGPDRAPQWPPQVVGALTHTRGWALACAAPASAFLGLGLDLEHVDGVRRMAIAPKIADAAERAWIDGDKRRLVAVFSAKEAIYKALYPHYGAFFGFNAVTLRWRGGGFEATLCQPLGDGYPEGARLPVAVRWYGDYVLTAVWLPV